MSMLKNRSTFGTKQHYKSFQTSGCMKNYAYSSLGLNALRWTSLILKKDGHFRCKGNIVYSLCS